MPDDDYELPEEDEIDVDQPSAASKAFAEARKRERNLKKELADAKAAAEKMADYKQKYEARQLADALAKLNLSDKYADLYRKVNPEGEVTVEALQAFAEEYSLPTSQPQPAAVETPAEPPAGFAPPIQAAPVPNTVTREQLHEIYKQQGPDRAAQLIKEGRVIWHNL